MVHVSCGRVCSTAHSSCSLTQQVSVHQSHQVPQHPEEEPGTREGGGEQEELVTPLHVQKCRPEVTHVEGAASVDVLDAHVAASIFGQDTPPLPQSPASTGHSSTE